MAEYEESEEYFLRLRSMVELCDDAIIGTDLNGRIFSWNNGAKVLYGYSSAEVIGKSVSIIIPPEHQNEFMGILERIRLPGKGRIYDTPRIKKDGTRIEVSDTVSPIIDKNGEIVGVSSIERDITELKRITEALQESEEKYRQLVDKSAETIVVVQDGTIRFVNPTATTMTGFSEWELMSKPFLQFVHPDDRAMLGERYQKRLRGEEIPAHYDFRVISKDGSTRWVEIRATVIEWKRRPATLNLLTDITETKQYEATLKESERKYRSLFENILDGYAYCRMLYDDQGRPVDWVYLRVNDTFRQITGLKDVIGKKISEVIPRMRESNPELFEIYDRVVQSGIPEKFEIEIIPLSLWLSISVYRPESGHFIAVFTNLTARKQAEMDLKKKTTEAIESSQRAEAYFDFLAHDIANILSPMIAYADMLKVKPNDPEQVTKFSDKILEQGKRASSLISNLRRLESIEKTHPNEIDMIDLRTIFSALEDNIRSNFPNKEIVVSYDIPDVQSMNVKGGEWVENVFRCVYDNAIRYSPGSAIKLEIKASILQLEGKDTFWQIEVSDNGPGIPDNVKSHFGDRISVADREFKGVASSLLFCCSMISCLGGELLVKDRVPGDYKQGTRVIIRLPKGE